MANKQFMRPGNWNALFNYQRRESSEVHVGTTPMGAGHPVRVQSMTNTSTMDTEGCVAQTLRIVGAGGEYVRLTTQGIREAKNLQAIHDRLRQAGCNVPLVADVHFNANVADEAALHAEKVRVNPGNYVDPARTFRHLEYTDEEYAAELQKIEAKFVPFLNICKAHHTAVRIGVNHGSLSDRIMSRYGDTPAGMVESCMEFLRICVREHFTDVVISIKSSNTTVMVRTVRLLVRTMEEEGMRFPLHLGVTEAGEGEDGRIKSAIGIGALLSDGLGDTIRVSLSEAPEAEIPVAIALRDYICAREGHMLIPGSVSDEFDYYNPQRRPTRAVANIGGGNVPVVMADYADQTVLSGSADDVLLSAPDYIYCGQTLPSPAEIQVAVQRGIGLVVDANVLLSQQGLGHLPLYPAFSPDYMPMLSMSRAPLKFLFLSYAALNEEVRIGLKYHPEVVVVAQSNHDNRTGELRALVHELWIEHLENPVVVFQHYAEGVKDDLQLKAAADMSALCIDRLIDGVYLHNQAPAGSGIAPGTTVQIAFNLLQASRLRITKTEFISCPGCGRTLYNLEDTIARIKQAVLSRAAVNPRFRTLKIGIMGCIVNGPGEMADADYGYVGAAAGKVSLYKQKECIEKNIPESEAVDRLLAFIEADLKD